MKNTIAAMLLLGTASLFAQSGQTAAPVTATLSLPAATVLPGVPFNMIVTLKNVSNHAASAGVVAQLHVTLPDGKEFVARERYILDPHEISSPETAVELAAGESRDFAVTWQFADPPSWSGNPEFTAPGTYQFSLVLEATDPQDVTSDYAGAIRTNTAQLRRSVAPGEDEELWTRMQTVAGGRWSDNGFTRLKEGYAILQDILQQHSSSQYYPYAVLLRAPANETADITRALDAASRFRGSPVYEQLLKYAADGAMSQALKANIRGDAKARDEYYAAAEKYYTVVLDQVSNVALRDDAQQARYIAHNRGRAR